MGLKDLKIKKQYRSDRNDLFSEFFLPCFEQSNEYDRAIEYVAVKSILAYYAAFYHFLTKNPKVRIVSGHRFRSIDLSLLSYLYKQHNQKIIPLKDFKSDEKFEVVRDMIKNKKLEIKIAIPNSEHVYGSFAEKIGIFRDENDDIIAFSGSSNETFDPENKNFESIDVFTSWDDKERVETKIKDFENLWLNKTKDVDVYDFAYANEKNLLKYATKWIFD